MKRVSDAVEQYCIQEDVFPYDCPGTVAMIIKQHTGKDVIFQSLPSIQQKQVCIIACVMMFLVIYVLTYN